MASVNLQSKDGGGGDGEGYTSPARSLGFSSPRMKIGTDESGELSPLVASVTSPAASSSSIHDLIMNASVDESDSGCQVELSDGGGNAVKKLVWSKPANDGFEVVDAACWPALGESTMPAPKSESSESLPKEPADSLNKPDTVIEPPPSSVNNHHTQQNSYRRSNGGPHPRTGGRGRPNQGRGYQEWSQHRSFNNNMPPQRGGYYRRGGYTRPPAHNSAPFIHSPVPLQVGPFGNNVIYHADGASGMIYYPGPPPPIFPGPFYYPVQDDPLHDKIIKQIDFYFSNDNLVKDIYLRRFMDEQGWVPVNLIAGFNKVSCLTDNVQLILDVMQKSAVVEVQGDKMRRRDDWRRWLIPPSVQDSLGSQLQGIRLDGRAPVA